LVYLIPYLSHVFQPLDLAYFKPLKSRYRSQITALAQYEDAAPVKKIRFIHYYKKARDEGLTASNIRGGWRASGIWPWNPRKVVRSSQVAQIEQEQVQLLPKTPLKSFLGLELGLLILTP
jgi:hypothetical protein